METKLLQSHQLQEAVALLKQGEVVAIPTETVYGLAADATNDNAVRKIFIAKGRPANHPLIVHIDTFDKVLDWAAAIPDTAHKLASHFWPGPLTMIFKKKDSVSNIITGGLETVALRIPQHPIALEIIKRLGTGIAAPSANVHKKVSPTQAHHVLKTLSGKIAAVIDGGKCSIGLESTIIDLTQAVPLLLRPGGITVAMIEQVLETRIATKNYLNIQAPGTMHVHYQPDTPLIILSLDQLQATIKNEKNCAVMHHSDIEHKAQIKYCKMPQEKERYAEILYETLFFLDNANVDKIFVEQPPTSSEWADVNDRLEKASLR